MSAPATEKPVVTPRIAQRVSAGLGTTVSIHGTQPVPQPAAAEAAPVPGQSWKFAKVFGIGDTLVFPDKSTFQFRAIKRNDGNGFMPNSTVVTTDETLANNLRAAAQNKATGVIEITAPAK
jgi:hypothetical protein